MSEWKKPYRYKAKQDFSDLDQLDVAMESFLRDRTKQSSVRARRFHLLDYIENYGKFLVTAILVMVVVIAVTAQGFGGGLDTVIPQAETSTSLSSDKQESEPQAEAQKPQDSAAEAETEQATEAEPETEDRDVHTTAKPAEQLHLAESTTTSANGGIRVVTTATTTEVTDRGEDEETKTTERTTTARTEAAAVTVGTTVKTTARTTEKTTAATTARTTVATTVPTMAATTAATTTVTTAAPIPPITAYLTAKGGTPSQTNFDLTITNNSSAPSSTIIVDIAVPSGVTLDPASLPSGVTCTTVSDTHIRVAYRVDSILPGGSRTVSNLSFTMGGLGNAKVYVTSASMM